MIKNKPITTNSASMTKNILVVDDDESVNAIFDFILQQAGYNTVSVHSGKECLEIIQSKQEIDLVFLDLKMPDMSGIEVFRELIKFRPNQLVIMMTGYLVNEALKEAFELGIYGVIYKPFDVEEVLGIIDKVFNLPTLA